MKNAEFQNAVLENQRLQGERMANVERDVFHLRNELLGSSGQDGRVQKVEDEVVKLRLWRERTEGYDASQSRWDKVKGHGLTAFVSGVISWSLSDFRHR